MDKKRYDWSEFPYPEGCGLCKSAKKALEKEANSAECNPSPYAICNRVPTDKSKEPVDECLLDIQQKCLYSALDFKKSQT